MKDTPDNGKTGRRSFLKGTAAFAGAAAANAFSCVEIASAAPIAVPTVDKLTIRVLVDSSYDQFFRPKQANGVSIAPPARGADFRKTLHNEWGLSLWLESQAAGTQRTLMLDYGYTPEVLLNNMELTGVDPSKLDALIVSHGHYDHFGGLLGFLDKFRDKLPAEFGQVTQALGFFNDMLDERSCSRSVVRRRSLLDLARKPLC